MEYFIYGMGIGYFLYPISKVITKMVINAYNAPGCKGDCNQGRRPCDCRGQ